MIHHLRHWLHKQRYPQRYAHLDKLLRNQALSREQVLRKQQQELADIIAYAVKNTAYYQEKFSPLLEPGGEMPPISALPILQKDDVTQRMDDLLARKLVRQSVMEQIRGLVRVGG